MIELFRSGGAFGLAFVISYFFTPIVKIFFEKMGWIEDPIKKQRKTGNSTALLKIPRGGGIPIYISLLIGSVLFLPLNSHILIILLASGLMLITGVLDDIYDISPLVRLGINLGCSLLVALSGIRIHFFSNPIGSGVLNITNDFWSVVITVIWLIWCSNIVGWSAGIEGQLPGFVSIAAFFVALVGLKYSIDLAQWPVILIGMTISGAYLGFLPYNKFPQKIMPGYSGKSLAGFLLGIMAIFSGAKIATLVYLLGVPMLDAIYVILRRIKNKKPIYMGDGDHLHHKLLKMGWKRTSISITYWLVSLGLGTVSLILNSKQKFVLFAMISVVFFVMVFQLSGHSQKKSSPQHHL